MPLRKFKRGQDVTVHLSTPDEWVDMKEHLSLADEREIKRRVMDGAAYMDARGGMTWRPGSGEDLAIFATLEQAITKWNIVDPTTNKVAAITSENIRCLEDVDVEILVEKGNELYQPELTVEQAKNSNGGGPTSSSEEAQLPPNSDSSQLPTASAASKRTRR